MSPSQWAARMGTCVLAAVGLFLALSLVTYTPLDIPLLSSSPQRPALNVGGAIGAWIGFLGRGGVGWASLLVPLLCCFWAWRCWQGRLAQERGISLMLASLCLLGSLGTLFALLGPSGRAQATLGGLSGFLLARAGHYYLGTVGTVLTALCIGGLAGVVISGQTMPAAGQRLLRRLGNELTALTRRPRSPRAAAPASASGSAASDGSTGESPPTPRVRIRSTVEPPPKTIPAVAHRPGPDGFQLPSLELLANPPPIGQRQLNEDLQVNARMLEETLREFGVEATVVNIDRGPSVTRYELTPAPGVKLTKIVSLADDLALVMKAASCHVVAPIPGKGRVGVDVPNSTTTVVYLKEIIASREFAGHPSPIALPIGKDVSGQAILTDLRECPHLLIAGATGSGKTVCLNSLLIGMLTRASPEQVKLLMVDPKMVELALFNDIPHLVAPVVTSAKRAGAALRWAVEEMERRYQLLAESGVRNIDAYNQRPPPPPPP
ncbi:MAG: DNA translocase FtsK 4TM domain-containing protein, partial [Candidatus Omnitrophota bacterium]|nr:DNA translocase FtsK 4TM domain-containing protein [Candidatus Omnitrophota bacterium]